MNTFISPKPGLLSFRQGPGIFYNLTLCFCQVSLLSEIRTELTIPRRLHCLYLPAKPRTELLHLIDQAMGNHLINSAGNSLFQLVDIHIQTHYNRVRPDATLPICLAAHATSFDCPYQIPWITFIF